MVSNVYSGYTPVTSKRKQRASSKHDTERKFTLPHLNLCKTQGDHLYTAPRSVSANKIQWFSLFHGSGSADMLKYSWIKSTPTWLKKSAKLLALQLTLLPSP